MVGGGGGGNVDFVGGVGDANLSQYMGVGLPIKK